jgi:hypothetical protein
VVGREEEEKWRRWREMGGGWFTGDADKLLTCVGRLAMASNSSDVGCFC